MQDSGWSSALGSLVAVPVRTVSQKGITTLLSLLGITDNVDG